MIRLAIRWLGTLVTGALLGGVLGRLIAMTFPKGPIHEIFSLETVAGIKPVHLNLQVIDLTFGCLFHFNLACVVGIVAAALLFKLLV